MIKIKNLYKKWIDIKFSIEEKKKRKIVIEQ